MLDKVLTDSKCPFNVALMWCTNAKNSLHNVHGFSPYQLALGQNTRPPALLTDTPPAHESPSSSDIVWQHLNTLHDARWAFKEAESFEKLKCALRHNVRTANDAMYVNGNKVYHIHRGDTKWRGPAIVLGQDGQQILLKHGGFYVHTHRCCVQHVNPISDKPLEPQAISTPKTTSLSVKGQHVAPNLTASSDSEDKGETLDAQAMPFSTPCNASTVPHPPTTPHKSDTPRCSPCQYQHPVTVLAYDLNSSSPERSRSLPSTTSSVIRTRKSSVNPDLSSLKKGVLASVQLNNDTVDMPRHLFRLLSCSGKSTGRYAYSWNVQDQSGNVSLIDFKHDVAEWSIAQDNDDNEILDEHRTTKVLLAEQSNDVHAAKLKELHNWSVHNVYDVVPDNDGQAFMTVRWVITTKDTPIEPTLKARLVAHGFHQWFFLM